MGATTFILMEIPAIHTASWFTALWLLPATPCPAAALMGALAFSFLMIAEVALAMGLSGQTPGTWFAGLWRAASLRDAEASHFRADAGSSTQAH